VGAYAPTLSFGGEKKWNIMKWYVRDVVERYSMRRLE
jgi:hypothetical protein